MLPRLQQPPSAGEWPHLEVIPRAGTPGPSFWWSRVAGASARETPNDLSAAPGLGRPPPSLGVRRGWAGTERWLPAKSLGSPPSLASAAFPASPELSC